jgi:hypothetical protein
MQSAPTLFDNYPKCIHCGDCGLWTTPAGLIVECPNITIGAAHNRPNAAAKLLRRSVDFLKQQKVPINSHLFSLAAALTGFTSQKPGERANLIRTHFGYVGDHAGQIRHFHKAIEDLRRVWLLPVGSRKDQPAGYWIITDIKDFADWVTRSKAAPITQLSTIHKVAKRNFPIFAEQMELEFWNDIEVRDMEAVDAAA